jgi:hypothetical protein
VTFITFYFVVLPCPCDVIPRNEAGEYGPTAIKDALKDLEDAIAMCGKRVRELATKRER